MAEATFAGVARGHHYVARVRTQSGSVRSQHESEDALLLWDVTTTNGVVLTSITTVNSRYHLLQGGGGTARHTAARNEKDILNQPHGDTRTATRAHVHGAVDAC